MGGECCGSGPGSELFEIKKAGDGIWAAVAAPAYKVNCNAAIIETGDGLMIVDTHSKPSAARVILARLRDITSKPVRYVVNTHFHWDHWQGNEAYPAAYPGAEIITNDITREAMLSRSGGRIADHDRMMPAEITALEKALAAATNASEKQRIESDLREARAYLEEVRALRPTFPTIAFEHTMRMIRGDREIELPHLGRAHTAGDVFVFLPKERTVVTGDAVVGWTPYMGDGFPEDWVKTLDRLAGLDFTRMILGHGDMTGREWLGLFRGYIADLIEAVRREAAAGATLDQIKERVPRDLAPKYEKPLSAYGDYRPWRQLILGNIERIYATAL